MPIRTTRLQGYDYTSTAMFFVTICTNDRACILGRVENDSVILSEIGTIVKECWCAIPSHFSHATLDEFVIMPNHLHGLLLLQSGITGRSDKTSRVRTDMEWPEGPGGACVTSESFGVPVTGSLPTIIRSFKSAVTKRVHDSFDPSLKVWQQRFHEHVIRTECDLAQARQYIRNNPLKWELDRMHPRSS